ncbi:MAG: DotH/IcmK family type IV secretion protein [Alphaproteobacteria bacterium]|nr:DotH/IcmK family type IV secretion protein [Alphaproteobacteria bacterium]
MLKLIRGCHLLYKSGQKFLSSAILGMAVGVGGLVFFTAGSYAAEPPSLAAAVREVVAPTQNTSAAGKSSSGAPMIERGDARPGGIDLSGVSPVSEDQLMLEQQAIETAARAAEEEEAKREEEHNRKSFKRASEGLMPLSSEQIRSFMQKLEITQEASQAPSSGAPKGEVKIANISLDPGGEPPQINLAAGYVTTIDIIDQTGEPWPILDVGVGGNFEVTPTQAGSHVVRVVPLTRLGMGNLSILVKGLSTPLIFRLVSGGATFHMRYDARVPALGPMARTPLINYRRPGPVAGDALMSMLLENAPPKEAKRMKVGGVDTRTMAWQVGERVYVRTPLSLLSPAWNASVSSADGMTVYEIGDAPVLLMSDNGAMIRARLLREDSHDK